MFSSTLLPRRARLTGRQGFTLIELLLVIGIIAVLAAIVILSINPRRQLAQARDAQRRSDVNTIINAVYQYAIDNNGIFPDSLRSTSFIDKDLNICKGNLFHKGGIPNPGVWPGDCAVPIAGFPSAPAGTGTDDGAGGYSGSTVSLRTLTGVYIVSVPVDPRYATTGCGYTMYKIRRQTNGRFRVTASGEIAGSISVTR